MNYTSTELVRLENLSNTLNTQIQEAKTLSSESIKATLNTSFDNLKAILENEIIKNIESKKSELEVINTKKIQNTLNTYLDTNKTTLINALKNDIDIDAISQNIASTFTTQNINYLNTSLKDMINSIIASSEIQDIIQDFKAYTTTQKDNLKKAINMVDIKDTAITTTKLEANKYIENNKDMIINSLDYTKLNLASHPGFINALNTNITRLTSEYLNTDKMKEYIVNEDIDKAMRVALDDMNDEVEYLKLRYKAQVNLNIVSLNAEMENIIKAKALLVELDNLEYREERLAGRGEEIQKTFMVI